MIKIKSYPKYRLAQLYFPDVERVTARQKLQTQIIARPVLRSALTSRERNPKAKYYTKEEVLLIVAMLGYPPYKESLSPALP